MRSVVFGMFGLLVACGSNNTNPTGDGGIPDSPTQGDAPATCNGSVIPTSITANLTLTKACSPWSLTAVTRVGGSASPVLTIEAGVKIVAAAGSALIVGSTGQNTGAGGLMAVGTASDAILFTSGAAAPAAGDWGGVALGDATLQTSQLSYVEIDYAGGDASLGVPNLPEFSLMVGEATSQALALPLSHLTFTHNHGDGVFLNGSQIGFGSGSGSITVSDIPSNAYPIAVHPNQASTLAGVSFSTGTSGHDGHLELIDFSTVGLAVVNTTQTWPAIPIPYDVAANAGLEIERNGSTPTTLTVAGPNTVMFGDSPDGQAGTGIYVDQVAKGGATLVASNVTFTSNSSSPTASSWGGVSVYMSAASSSSITGSTFEYAGSAGDWSTAQTCTGVIFVDDRDNTNETLMGPVLTGNTFSNCAGDAIFVGLPTSGGLSNASTYSTNTFPSSQGVCTQ